MKKVRYKGNYLELYDSIGEMPITRFQAYNRFCLIDSGIGGGLEGVQKHIDAIKRLMSSGKHEDAAKELVNYHQNLIFIIEKSNPELMSFICLVKSINGKDLPELTADIIESTIKKLGKDGLTIGKVRGALNEFKKKVILSLKFSFQNFRIVQKQKSFSPT